MKIPVKSLTLLILIMVILAIVGFHILQGYDRLKDAEKTKTVIVKVDPTSRPDNTIEVKERIVAYVMKSNYQLSRRMAKEIVEEVYKQPDPLILLAIMKAESGYAPWAVSKKNAKGLGQIMYYVHGKELIAG